MDSVEAGINNLAEAGEGEVVEEGEEGGEGEEAWLTQADPESVDSSSKECIAGMAINVSIPTIFRIATDSQMKG